MNVALLTVGDELLAGDTTNTNATWLASEITSRGATVRRILTIPDDHDTIADWTRRYHDWYDAVVVTGGLGGTPDDVTMAAVADGLDRERELFTDVRDGLVAKSEAFREANPDIADEYEFDMEFAESASLPVGARPLVTDAGWAPGCAVDGIYVLPGIPAEMKAMFELVAEEFDGETDSRTLYTPTPEGAMGDVLTEVRELFDTDVGSYPADPDTPNRLKVVGEDEAEIERTVTWLREKVETVPDPE